MSRRAGLVGPALLALTLLIACTRTSPGEDPTPSRASQGPHAHASLLADARANGSVGVIVTLAVDYRPEAELSRDDVTAQRRAIAEAQDRLLASLRGSRYTVAARYRSLPQIALRVDERGLRVLIGSPLVRSMAANETSAPTGTAD